VASSKLDLRIWSVLFLVMVCFAANSVITRYLVLGDRVSPFLLTVVRFLSGLGTLLILAFIKPATFRHSKPRFPHFLAAFFLGAYAFSISYGYLFIPVAAGTFVFYTFAGGGAIINTSSELGLLGARGLAAYCASKAAVINMTRAMAVDFAPRNIRVNCLCPGPVMTPMLETYFASQANSEETRKNQLRTVPLGRFGRPEEIASAALFLASEDSSFVTGAVLVADGGATATYGL